jgi:hypothetical protein
LFEEASIHSLIVPFARARTDRSGTHQNFTVCTVWNHDVFDLRSNWMVNGTTSKKTSPFCTVSTTISRTAFRTDSESHQKNLILRTMTVRLRLELTEKLTTSKNFTVCRSLENDGFDRALRIYYNTLVWLG